VFNVLIQIGAEGEFCGGCEHSCHDNDECTDTCGIFMEDLKSKCTQLSWQLLRCEECLAAESIINGDHQTLDYERRQLASAPNGNWKLRQRLDLLNRYLPYCKNIDQEESKCIHSKPTM
jgi:hypothetical protein